MLCVLLASCTVVERNITTELEQEQFIENLVQYDSELRQENKKLRQAIQELERDLRRIEIQNERLELEVSALRQDMPSGPANMLNPEDVWFTPEAVTINVSNAFGSQFLGTGSMEPIINKHSFGIQVTDKKPSLGDIIAFKSNFSDVIVVHRVIALGQDVEGWFAITKGDNNRMPDPGKRRLEDIVGVTVGILY